MNRLIVAFLAALDAVLAAAGGIAFALAPLTLLWIIGLGGTAEWGALWPAGAAVWQLGHLVPLTITLPDTYLAAAGIDPAAATFTLSLAPLAFAVFTGVFAARSGGRAAAAGAPVTGAVTGSLVFAALTVAVALTSGSEIATAQLWQTMLFPAAMFAVPVVLGAGIGAWVHDIPPLARVRERVDDLAGAWPSIPGLVVRGTAIAVVGLAGVGALVLAAAVFARGGQMVALFQAGNVDVLGAIVLALAQLLYLPTLVVWGLGFAAGPGFALGTGTAVAPSGTQLGVVPGIPVLGAVPESASPWLLLLALLPVGVGVLTGWMLRSRLVRDAGAAEAEAYGPRLALLGGVTVLTAAIAALAGVFASGSIGPDRLTDVGPQPGALALAVALEVALGAGILLLAPRRAEAEVEAGRPVDEAPFVAEARGAQEFPAFTESRSFAPYAGFSVPETRAWGDAAPLDEPRETVEAARQPAPDAGATATSDGVGEPTSDAAATPPPDDLSADDRASDEDDASAHDDPHADEQSTEPIAGIERGSGGQPHAGERPDTSVD